MIISILNSDLAAPPPPALPAPPCISTEVMRWVQETQLPINAEERQLLLSELELEQQARSPGAAAGGSAAAGWESRVATTRAEQELEPGWPESSGAEGAAAEEEHSFQQKAVQPQAARGASAEAAAAPAGNEIEPAGADGSSAGGAAGEAPLQPSALGLDWLGRCQHQMLQGAAAILRPLLGPQAEEWRQRLHAAVGGTSTSAPTTTGEGSKAAAAPAGGSSALLPDPDPAAALRQLTRTALGCALLYAAYAERRAIRRGMGRARHAVAVGVSDLLRMALNLSINPLAA